MQIAIKRTAPLYEKNVLQIAFLAGVAFLINGICVLSKKQDSIDIPTEQDTFISRKTLIRTPMMGS